MSDHSDLTEARTVKVIYAVQIIAFALSMLIYAH
jgi:hypothetical protein